MPPTIGAAIRFHTSEPVPVAHMIGINLMNVVDYLAADGKALLPVALIGFLAVLYKSRARQVAAVRRTRRSRARRLNPNRYP